MTSYWKKYYLEPSGYAERYTRWSRNVFNIGLAALIVSAIYVWSLSFMGFAFAEYPEKYFTNLKEIEGVYGFIGGGKSSSPRVCLHEPEKKSEIVCTSAFDALQQPRNQLDGKLGHAWVAPDVGIVKLVVDGQEIMSPYALQQYLQTTIKKFLWLIATFFLMACVSIFRQWLLVNKKGKK